MMTMMMAMMMTLMMAVMTDDDDLDDYDNDDDNGDDYESSGKLTVSIKFAFAKLTIFGKYNIHRQ